MSRPPGEPADRRWMQRALVLAEKGRDTVAPNPMVGAVVVRDGKVVGEGYHREAGQEHAEVLALRAAGDRARGATLYVNLEPCCHVEKRTPPCTDAIVRAGVARVVVAMRDPNPRVFGRGLERLAGQRVDVSEGLFADRAFEQNRGFSSLIRQGRPYVTLKGAMSLDGKIATSTGDSQWISGSRSLAYAHRLRRDHDAILVGISTAMKDDPRLTNRLSGSHNHQPARVILDSTGRLPPDSRLFGEEGGGPVLHVSGPRAPERSLRQLEKSGARILVLPEVRAGEIDLRALLAVLAEEGLLTVLVEGGSRVNASFLSAGLVDRIRVVLAPLLIGGTDAIGWLGGSSPPTLAQARRLPAFSVVRRLGDDLLVGADFWGPDSLPGTEHPQEMAPDTMPGTGGCRIDSK